MADDDFFDDWFGDDHVVRRDPRDQGADDDFASEDGFGPEHEESHDVHDRSVDEEDNWEELPPPEMPEESPVRPRKMARREPPVRHHRRKSGMDRRKGLIILSLLVVAMVVFALMWYFIIPRTEVNVTTVYHEGSTNVININSKLENSGTLAMEKVYVHIIVTNDTHTFIDDETHIDTVLKGEEQEIKTYFVGNHHDTYRMTIQIEFESGGISFTRTYTYTSGGYMTESHQEKIDKVHL